VVAAAVDPAGQRDGGADMFFSQRTAGMCPEQNNLLRKTGLYF
jgi:hypothetical protein